MPTLPALPVVSISSFSSYKHSSNCLAPWGPQASQARHLSKLGSQETHPILVALGPAYSGAKNYRLMIWPRHLYFPKLGEGKEQVPAADFLPAQLLPQPIV